MQHFSLGAIGLDFVSNSSRGVDLVDKVASYGIRWLELLNGINYESERELHDLVAAADKRGVRIVSVSSISRLNTNPQCWPTILETIRHAAIAGAPYSVMLCGGSTVRSRDESLKCFAEDIKPCLEEAKKRGVMLLLENDTWGRETEDLSATADGTLEVLERVGASHLGLLWDPANFQMGTEEGYPYSYELLKSYVRYVHLKDFVKYDERIYSWKAERPIQIEYRGTFVGVETGAGSLNCQGILGRLIADGFAGVVTVELFTRSRSDYAMTQSLRWLDSQGIAAVPKGGS